MCVHIYLFIDRLHIFHLIFTGMLALTTLVMDAYSKQVVDVVAHRLPHLKELTVDAAESLSNSSVFQLLSTCKNLTKIDLTG